MASHAGRAPTALDELRHPEADKSWFRELSEERQEAFHRDFRDRVGQSLERFRAHTWRLGVEALQLGLIFALFDLWAPFASGWTTFLALAVGALVGRSLQVLEGGRLLSGTLGLLAFFLLEWGTRGGLSALHLFLLFPVAALSALQGLRRENGD